MKKRLSLILALISFVPLGQTFFIGSRLALTSFALYISFPENIKALPLRQTKDSKGRDMRFYITRGYEKAQNGDRRGAIKDYSTAIRMHDKDPYAADLLNYQYALEMRAYSKGYLGNEKGACSDLTLAAKYGSQRAKDKYFQACK